MARNLDGEQHVIAATHHLIKVLESINNLSDDMKTLLSNLDIHLSTMMISFDEDEAENTEEIESKLVPAQQTIMSYHSKIWDSNRLIISEYLQAVSEVQRLSERLKNMPLRKTSKSEQLFYQSQTVLQIAMERLQKELIHILAQNKQHDVIYGESFVSTEDDSWESNCTEVEEYVMDLIRPDVVPQIKTIATIMFDSGYSQEFCQDFTMFWREYLMVLDIDKFTIEDVLQMEWKYLNSRITKWRRTIRSVIQVYMASAKRLFDHILGEYGNISTACLVEASKAPLMSLLNFGQAISIGPHKPEYLYCLLDMYEDLTALMPEVEALFPDESGSFIRIEFQELETRLKDSAKTLFEELGNYIATCSSTTAFPNGGIHILTKYIMNYILGLSEYDETLNLLLNDGSNPKCCSLGSYLQFLISVLEENLEEKSNLYKDYSLKHIFMMNNIHYIVEKIKDSKIMPYFGEEWIKHHIGKFQQHARWYERFTWSSILELLHHHGKVGKVTLKARLRDFTAAFENVYKCQTRWCVADYQLREDLRIRASQTVILPYRNFISRVKDCIGEKHIRYTEHDLETYILDLLEGSSKSLNKR